ncbi:MAG: hypothetical protein [Caudoviricetes sp.]|nr:MAG: hypothetical protein [Caudoviricetes sp.]
MSLASNTHLLVEVDGVAVGSSQCTFWSVHSTFGDQLHLGDVMGQVKGVVDVSQLLNTNVVNNFQTSSFMDVVNLCNTVDVLRFDRILLSEVRDVQLNEATLRFADHGVSFRFPVLILDQVVAVLGALDFDLLLGYKLLFEQAQLVDDRDVTWQFNQNVGQFDIFTLAQAVNVFIDDQSHLIFPYVE